MEAKQIFIQLNEETQFNTVKITRQLNNTEDRVDRQRNGLNAAIKMEFGKTSPVFLKDLNDLYQSTEIPLLKNLTVLMIYKKWTINKSIFEVLRFLFAEINDSNLIENKELMDKIIHLIELQTNSDVEHIKYKIWLTSKIILKVYTDGNFENLDNFIYLIWRNSPHMPKLFVPDVFKPKIVDAYFKPIWFAFSIFKKQKATPEIYYSFFNDLFPKLLEPEVAENDFLKFLKIIFEKNKIEVVKSFTIKDYMRLYEIKKVNNQLFYRLPDLSKTAIEHSYKDRTSSENHSFKLIYNLFTEFGISYFFISHFMNGNLNTQEKGWFYDVLQGRNLVYSKNLPFTLTKKTAHFFNIIPQEWKNDANELDFKSPKSLYGITNHKYTLTQSLIYCTIYFEVKDEIFAKEVLRNLRGADNLDFWISTLCKLNHKGLRVVDMNQIIDYIDDQVIRNGRQIDFNTKKLSNLLAESSIWHEELRLMRMGKYGRTFNLPKSDINTYKIEYKDKKYKVIQLLTNKDLIEEGRTLSHCVGTYTNNCIDRGSYIFSLCLEQENEENTPLITIEVNANTIRQKKGKKNRPCSQEEDYIIRKWAKENKLKFI
jgi:hypothetical protein